MTRPPSPRELEVFAAIRDADWNRKKAAHALGLTPATVNVHVGHLYLAYGVHCMAALAEAIGRDVAA